MTYSILSTDNADVLATYPTRDEALAAVAVAARADARRVDVVAVVAFDEDGMPQGALEGDELRSELFGSSAVAI
jgi:hypothetical protein